MRASQNQTIQERLDTVLDAGWRSALCSKNHDAAQWILNVAKEPARLDKTWAASAVRLCAESLDIKPIEMLMTAKASATLKGNDGFSGLTEAAFLAWPEALETMRRCKIEPLSVEQLSELLHFALAGASLCPAWNYAFDVHGSKESWPDGLGGAPRIAARASLVEKLLAEDADPEALGPLGCSPLALAAASGQPVLVEALLRSGADAERLSMDKSPRDFVLLAELPHSGEGIARGECLRLLGATGKIPGSHKRIGPKGVQLIDWFKGERKPGSPIPAHDDGYGHVDVSLDFGKLKRYRGFSGLPKALANAYARDNRQTARFEPDPSDESFSYSWTEYADFDSWEKIPCAIYVSMATARTSGGNFTKGDKIVRVGFAEGEWIRFEDLSLVRLRHFPKEDATELASFVSGARRPSDAGRKGGEYLASLLVLANHAWGGFDWALSREKQERDLIEKAAAAPAGHGSRPRI